MIHTDLILAESLNICVAGDIKQKRHVLFAKTNGEILNRGVFNAVAKHIL